MTVSLKLTLLAPETITDPPALLVTPPNTELIPVETCTRPSFVRPPVVESVALCMNSVPPAPLCNAPVTSSSAGLAATPISRIEPLLPKLPASSRVWPPFT